MKEPTVKMMLEYNPSNIKVTDKDLEPPEKKVTDVLMEEMIESLRADGERREKAFMAYLEHCEKQQREALLCLKQPEVKFDEPKEDRDTKWRPIFYGTRLVSPKFEREYMCKPYLPEKDVK